MIRLTSSGSGSNFTISGGVVLFCSILSVNMPRCLPSCVHADTRAFVLVMCPKIPNCGHKNVIRRAVRCVNLFRDLLRVRHHVEGVGCGYTLWLLAGVRHCDEVCRSPPFCGGHPLGFVIMTMGLLHFLGSGCQSRLIMAKN